MTPNNQDDELDKLVINLLGERHKHECPSKCGTGCINCRNTGMEQMPCAICDKDGIAFKARNEFKAAILAWHNKQLQEVERAYGGCHNCYGTDGDIGGFEGPIKVDKPIELKYCDCDRGMQLEQLSKSKGEE